MEIGRKDIFWNYLATFLKIASSAMLLPFILRMMSSEMVGIWTIFMTITVFSTLLDFGFNPSFTRNVTYVFSGVKSLMTNGYETVNYKLKSVDYGLLKGLIHSMRFFYSCMSLIVFLLLTTLGSYYIHYLLISYHGDHLEVFIAWGILCFINTYNIFTSYYDSLLQGIGLIKRSKQIIIIGQGVYILVASILILNGFGLIAVVSAQTLSVIIIRTLSYYYFFTPAIKLEINNAVSRDKQEIFKAIYPNALKMGLTSFGAFLVSRSTIIIGSFYLTLSQIASFGITMQLIGVISTLATIYTATYQPKIVQLRVEHNHQSIKELYLKGQLVLLFTYFVGGMGLLFLGSWGLHIIGSKTQLMPFLLIAIALIVSFLETNHATAGSILLTKNEVPFFKASLLSGGLVVLLLFLLFNLTNLSLWVLIISPGIAQGLYQNWKWPIEVIKELKIKRVDISNSILLIRNSVSQFILQRISSHE